MPKVKGKKRLYHQHLCQENRWLLYRKKMKEVLFSKGFRTSFN